MNKRHRAISERSSQATRGDDAAGPRPATIQSVDRALCILRVLAEATGERTLGEIAAETQLARPTAYRLTATLVARGFVVRTNWGTYALGPACTALAYGGAARSMGSDADRARETAIARCLAFARDTVNETILLSVRVGLKRVLVAQAESRQPIRRFGEIGESVDLYVGAASKVLLAAFSVDAAQAYLEKVARSLEPQVEKDWVSTRMSALAAVRARERSTTKNERGIGGAAVAAPVLDRDGSWIAAVHASVPMPRFTHETEQHVTRVVVACANEISALYAA